MPKKEDDSNVNLANRKGPISLETDNFFLSHMEHKENCIFKAESNKYRMCRDIEFA